MTERSAPRSESSRRGRAQYGLRALMMVMLLASVLAALFAGTFRGDLPRPVFVFLTVAAPLGIVLILSVFGQVLRLVARWRRR